MSAPIALLHHLQAMLAGMLAEMLDDPVPDPGSGVMPPGQVGAKVLLLLKWLAALATAAAVAGIIWTGARMAISHRRGDETNIAQLGWVLFSCLLIGSAAAIVTALMP